jgi:signal transduction histidine kinase
VSGRAAAAFAAGTHYLDRAWVAEAQPILAARGVHLTLTHPDGRRLLGFEPDAARRPAIRLASTTQLPWTVQVFDTGGQDEGLVSRRRLLLASMGVLLALILVGGWFIGRSVGRELALAGLQSDFVSAVSHEFRTPLTTLCQLSELLAKDRVASAGDRRQYYALLHKESQRLRRLVESLLNFGRLEAGTLPFRFEEVDLSELVRQSVDEFTESGQPGGHRVEIEAAGGGPIVRADRETLRCVLWNLLDNAAKYSPSCETVWIEVSRNGTGARIAVRDRGVGIPPGEHRRIFEKFVRGTTARASDVRGTGIGLAMARQIVRAYGGEITVDSEPGRGSTFTVALPALDQAERHPA